MKGVSMIALLGDFWLRIEGRLKSGRSREVFPALQYLIMKTIRQRLQELFHPPDNHFNADGRTLFAKFVTDTDLARCSTNYYAHQ